MTRDYFGQFLKDSEKIFRDANGLVKKNVEILVNNVRDETRRVGERVDRLNRMAQLSKTLQESSEGNAPNEKNQAFLVLMETVHRMVDCLQNAHTLCSPMLEEEPRVNPGALEGDVAQLEQDRHLLREQINGFRQLVPIDELAYAPHLVFLSQLDSIIQGRALRTICLEIRNVVDRGDRERIRDYGNLAGGLIQQLDGMVNSLNWELNHAEEVDQLLPAEDNTDRNNGIV